MAESLEILQKSWIGKMPLAARVSASQKRGRVETAPPHVFPGPTIKHCSRTKPLGRLMRYAGSCQKGIMRISPDSREGFRRKAVNKYIIDVK